MLVLALLPAVAVCAAAAPARAQADRRPRPRMEVAVGVGASLDDGGFDQAKGAAVPSFFVMGGFGSGTLGVDLGVFASSAAGRYHEPSVMPVDRLGLEGILVVRPLADHWPTDWRYGMRVLRLTAIDVGLGVERASRFVRVPETVYRIGSLIGLHFDLPLTPLAASRELRLRLAVRRFYGASQVTFPDGEPVINTRGEIFAALAAVF
jgi:hypothetical protein